MGQIPSQATLATFISAQFPKKSMPGFCRQRAVHQPVAKIAVETADSNNGIRGKQEPLLGMADVTAGRIGPCRKVEIIPQPG